MSKKAIISVVCIISLIIGILISIKCFGFSTTVDNDLKNYSNNKSKVDITNQVMPEIDELPLYESVHYEYRHKRMLMFSADTILLAAKYDEETYEIEKEKLNNLNYAKEKVETIIDNEDLYTLPEYEFSINSFNFKVISSDVEGIEYPKRIGFIANSDEKTSIVYLFFNDADLDFISDKSTEGEMKLFIKQYFEFDW